MLFRSMASGVSAPRTLHSFLASLEFAAMKRKLRLLALAVALVGAVFWFFGGPNLGRTQTRIPVIRKDAATGREVQEWESRFVPGVDFLVGALACAAVIVVISTFARSASAASGSTPRAESQS